MLIAVCDVNYNCVVQEECAEDNSRTLHKYGKTFGAHICIKFSTLSSFNFRR